MSKKKKYQFKKVCYGILGPDRELYMSESCICEDATVLRTEECAMLNEDTDGGYKVVPLYVRIRNNQ